MRDFTAKNWIGILAIVGGIAFVLGYEWPPKAAANPGPGHIDSFQVSCGTSATVIRAPSAAMYALECQNTSTTEIAFGDDDLAAPAAADSPIYCATNCPSQQFGGNVREAYCRVDSGTVTINCIAMVAQAP